MSGHARCVPEASVHPGLIVKLSPCPCSHSSLAGQIAACLCGHSKCKLLLAQARPRMIQHLSSMACYSSELSARLIGSRVLQIRGRLQFRRCYYSVSNSIPVFVSVNALTASSIFI